MTEPFTPELVHDLVKVAMMGSRQPQPPDAKSEEVSRLTEILNHVRWTAEHCRSQLPTEFERGDAIARALRILTEEAPKLRDEYIEDLKSSEQSNWEVAHFRAKLKTLDTLVAAAQAAKRLSFYPRVVPFGFEGTTGCWTECVKFLMEAFKLTMGGSKETAYRFIEAVAPKITGERPTLNAIKTEVKRKRWESRGKHV